MHKDKKTLSDYSKLLRMLIFGLQTLSGFLYFPFLCSKFSLLNKNYFDNKQHF